MAYEPSTEDVRAAWYGLTQNADSFDMWLLKERERVMNLAGAVYKAEERERIIKLLEEEKQEHMLAQNHNGAAVLRDAIELIKGENK